MLPLTDKEIAEYFRRSFIAVDGLWFMRVEERAGFETALETDNQVWQVLPKIQARLLRSMANRGDSPEALAECLATKLTLEGFRFTSERLADGFQIVVTGCPWHDQMVRSERAKLSERIGSRICPTEYSVWAAEFGGLRFELGDRLCRGDKSCLLKFLH
jgi:predicted ArsR family transcriptional regulator